MSADLTATLLSIGNDHNRSQVLKAPFSYIGSKLKLLPFIYEHLPKRPKYVEHFGGSGVVLLNRPPSKLEVFNDANSGVTAFFRCCADSQLIQQLCGRVRFMLRSREEFVWCIETWENCTDVVERAARWYYTIQNSFNKTGRMFRRSTGYTAVDGALQNSLPLFYPVHERLKRVMIENLDYRTSFADYDDEDTVHYCDPPYYLQENPYQVKFTKDDHKELLERIFDLDGYVALSGYESDLYNKYPWTKIERIGHVTRATGNANLDSNNRAGMDYLIETSKNTVECLFIKKERN